jgi:hypothetical protein
MFIIRSYIVKPDKEIFDINTLEANHNNLLVEISKISQKMLGRIDFSSLEGVIYIKYRKEILLNYIHCDYVEDLWQSLLNMIEGFLKKGEGIAYFPSSPSEIRITRINKELVGYTRIDGKTFELTLPIHEFIKSLLDSAEYFFKTFIELDPTVCKYSIERIKKLRTNGCYSPI